jgi:hypothetical protein
VAEDKNPDDTADENQSIGNIFRILNADHHRKGFYRIIIHIPDVKRKNECGDKEKLIRKIGILNSGRVSQQLTNAQTNPT